MMKLAVLMLYEHVAPGLTSVPHAYLARHVPASVINPEQQFENRLQLHTVKKEKTSLVRLLAFIDFTLRKNCRCFIVLQFLDKWYQYGMHTTLCLPGETEIKLNKSKQYSSDH